MKIKNILFTAILAVPYYNVQAAPVKIDRSGPTVGSTNSAASAQEVANGTRALCVRKNLRRIPPTQFVKLAIGRNCPRGSTAVMRFTGFNDSGELAIPSQGAGVAGPQGATGATGATGAQGTGTIGSCKLVSNELIGTSGKAEGDFICPGAGDGGEVLLNHYIESVTFNGTDGDFFLPTFQSPIFKGEDVAGISIVGKTVSGNPSTIKGTVILQCCTGAQVRVK